MISTLPASSSIGWRPRLQFAGWRHGSFVLTVFWRGWRWSLTWDARRSWERFRLGLVPRSRLMLDYGPTASPRFVRLHPDFPAPLSLAAYLATTQRTQAFISRAAQKRAGHGQPGKPELSVHCRMTQALLDGLTGDDIEDLRGFGRSAWPFIQEGLR